VSTSEKDMLWLRVVRRMVLRLVDKGDVFYSTRGYFHLSFGQTLLKTITQINP